MRLRRIRPAIVLLATLLGFVAGPSAAQDAFPSKTIRLVVPYPAGGTTDIMARLLMEKASASLKQPVVIDNRAGGGGTIGMTAVARATPDGYTIGLGNNGPNAIAPNLPDKPGYDPIQDFRPISLIAEMPLLIVVNASSPYHSLSDFIRAAKAKPGTLNFASTGPASFGHVTGSLFAREAGLNLVHVPYKGGAEYFQALLGGQIESLFGTYLEAAPHLKSGKLRALAVTSASRHPQLPDVPAVSETLAGFDAVGWFGFLAPKGTPQPVIDRLHSEIAAATRDPGVRARMAELGFVPQLTTPTEFGERIRADLTKWGGLVRTPGVVLN